MTNRDEMICENIKLVGWVISRYYCKFVGDEDIFQIGCVGLIKAVDIFDQTNRATFAHYAIICIRNEIKMHFQKANCWQKECSIEDVAWSTNDGDAVTIGDFYGEDDDHSDIDIKQFISNLNERDKMIIRRRLAGASLQDIGAELGVTKSSVSRRIGNIRKKYIKEEMKNVKN